MTISYGHLTQKPHRTPTKPTLTDSRLNKAVVEKEGYLYSWPKVFVWDKASVLHGTRTKKNAGVAGLGSGVIAGEAQGRGGTNKKFKLCLSLFL